MGDKRGFLPTLALGVLLLTAHAVAALHSVEHDADLLDGRVCATCVTAAQLGAACVASPLVVDLDHPGGIHGATDAADYQSTHLLAVRQRGPPAPLPSLS